MANGTAAHLLLLEPASAPAQPKTRDKPEMAIERQVGEVTADGVIMLASAMESFSANGSMAACTRAQGGEIFVRLYGLQQSTPAGEISQLMHTHGKRVLWERHGAALRQHYGPLVTETALDASLDELIGHLCSVLARVTETERIYQLAWAN